MFAIPSVPLDKFLSGNTSLFEIKGEYTKYLGI